MEKNPTNTLKPLLIFFALSFGLILLIALPGILSHYGLIAVEIPVEPFLILGSWTPNIAAVLVLWWVLSSPAKARALFRRWTMWREKPQWYLAAASPLLVAGLAALLYHWWDGTPPDESEAATLPMLLGLLVLSLITGAMGEELGWRGFALPWLQTKVNALGASIIIGAAWGLWHLPLWFIGLGWEEMPFGLFAYNCIAVSVIMTWVCNHTMGNMLLITLLHWFYNFGWNLMGLSWGVPMSASLLYQAVVLTVYAGIIVAWHGPARLRREGPIPVDGAEKTWLS
jgi:uncharacterized protein